MSIDEPSDREGLEARVRRLEDERDARAVLYRHADAWDHGDEAGYYELFTDAARWRRGNSRFGDLHVFSERSEQEHYFRHHAHAPEAYFSHGVVNGRVEVNGDEANIIGYDFLVAAHSTGPYIRSFARTIDRLERQSDGAWQIVDHVSELEARDERTFPEPHND